MTRPVASWGPPKPEDEVLNDCTDPNCATCLATKGVLDAGARVICEAAGGDFDAIRDPHTLLHYRTIADAVFTRMSRALLDLGMAHPTGEPT